MAEMVVNAAKAPRKERDLADWFDEISVRFIINLPEHDLTQPARLGFSIEEAHWFYEDFVRPVFAIESPNHQPLPTLSLKRFITLLFLHCPLLRAYAEHAEQFYETFMEYKGRVPVRGLILLDESMENVLLVKGYKKGAKWSFPRGKIARGEDDLTCAIREVYEETGYDAKEAGLIDDDNRADVKSFEQSVRDQDLKMFVVRGVPLETHFAPRTRKEISKIKWWSLADLPTLKKTRLYEQQQQLQVQQEGVVAIPTADPEYRPSNFFMVAPFIGPLKHWVRQERRKDRAKERAKHPRHVIVEDDETETGGEELMPEPEVVEDREDDEDIKRLIARLHLSQLHTAESPDAPDVPEEETDAAVALKGLLGVVSPSTAPEVVQGPQEHQPLLSLLGGAPRQHGHPYIEAAHPDPQNANIPHPHYPHVVRDDPAFASGPTVQPFAGRQIAHPFNTSGPQGRLQSDISDSAFQLLQAVPAHGPSNIPFEPWSHGPYQAQNIQKHAQLPHYPDTHRPSAPEASMPMPKLTEHTQSLLDVFRSPPTQHQPPLTSLDKAMRAIGEAGRPLSGEWTPTIGENPPPVPQQSKPKPRTQQQDLLLSLFRSSNTGDASQPRPPLPNEATTLSVPNEPIELSANPSSPYHPRAFADTIQTASRSSSGAFSSHPPVQPSLVLETSGLRARSPGLTSATVSGPLNAPAFEATKRIRKVSPVELGLGGGPTSPASVGRPLSRGFKPVQILQRPSSKGKNAQKDSDSEPASRSGRGVPPSRLRKSKEISQAVGKEKTSQPALQPGGVQILKRPASLQAQGQQIHTLTQLPSATRPAQKVAASQIVPSPGPTSSPQAIDDKKSALLALFGTSSKQPTSAARQPAPPAPLPQQPKLMATPDADLTSLISPVSPLPTAHGLVSSLGGLQSGQVSRMGSLVSVLESPAHSSRKESLVLSLNPDNARSRLPSVEHVADAPLLTSLLSEPITSSPEPAVPPFLKAPGYALPATETAVEHQAANTGGAMLNPKITSPPASQTASLTTPTTADKDRNFLLGYLRDVARSGG